MWERYQQTIIIILEALDCGRSNQRVKIFRLKRHSHAWNFVLGLFGLDIIKPNCTRLWTFACVSEKQQLLRIELQTVASDVFALARNQRKLIKLCLVATERKTCATGNYL